MSGAGCDPDVVDRFRSAIAEKILLVQLDDIAPFLLGPRGSFFGRAMTIGEIGVDRNTMTCKADVVIAQAQKAADRQYLFPLPLGSEGLCRIDGNLATSAR